MNITKTLKKFSQGQFDWSVLGVILIILIVGVILFLVPAVILFSLHLMGVPVHLTLKSVLGAYLLFFALRFRISSQGERK